MNLGDFFSAAPFGRPVNAQPIKFTCVCTGPTLPGGQRNPSYPGAYAAQVEASFVFVDADGVQDARDGARCYLAERAQAAMKRGDAGSAAGEEESFNLEFIYQVLQRALHEWDPKERRVGDRLFPSPNVMRSLVLPRESNRVLLAYNEYVAAEHPEVAPDDKTFRGAGGPGAGSPGAAPEGPPGPGLVRRGQ